MRMGEQRRAGRKGEANHEICKMLGYGYVRFSTGQMIFGSKARKPHPHCDHSTRVSQSVEFHCWFAQKPASRTVGLRYEPRLGTVSNVFGLYSPGG
jgi:hypothetical protein